MLAGIPGYRLDRRYLAAGPRPAGQRISILQHALEVELSARSYDLLHVHGEVASALSLPALAWRPSVVTLHGLNLLRRTDGPAKFAASLNLRTVVLSASRTICVSNAEFHDLRGAVGHLARRAVVIHNGIERSETVTDAERTAARAELGLEPAQVAGVWIGSLEELKDPLTPIRAAGEAARSGAPLVLLVVGDGLLLADVKAAARQAGDSIVRVLGFRSDVRRILSACDFFVLSSRREGFSFALLEAMSIGLVPIVSDAPANVEAVGDAGIVVGFGDEDGFAAAFARVAREGAARRGLGAAAQERVGREFSGGEMLDRTEALYEQLCGSG